LPIEIGREFGSGDTSHAFDRPKSGRIAVNVINHLGDKVMKVFQV
jgi:adenine-specific DNA-methyltransferase